MITLILILSAILVVAMVIGVIAAAIGVIILPILDILIGIGVVMLLWRFVAWLKGNSKDKES